MKKVIWAITCLSLLWLVTAPLVFADQGAADDESRFGGHMKARIEARMDDLAKQLNLTADQQKLFDSMKGSMGDYIVGRMESRGKMMQSIREAMDSEKPDYAKVSKDLKSAFRQKDEASFDKMVDDAIAFHASLTPAQKDIVKKFQEERREKMRARFRDR